MKSVIVGANGQDGRLLRQNLEGRGHTVVGVDRHNLDILHAEAVHGFLHRTRPDQVYYLAAYHHSSEHALPPDRELFRKSYSVQLDGVVNFLDAIKQATPQTRLFYASSCHVFDDGSASPQNESSPFQPANVYGMSKLAGMLACRFYREQRNVFAASGILFNHESIYRPERFLSRKVTRAAVAIKRGTQAKLKVAALDACVDWGYAGDYVEAMRLILDLDHPDDFVIATNSTHSVRELISTVFSHFGLNASDWVEEDGSLARSRSSTLQGDFGKLQSMTGWKPQTSFHSWVTRMAEQEWEMADEVA